MKVSKYVRSMPALRYGSLYEVKTNKKKKKRNTSLFSCKVILIHVLFEYCSPVIFIKDAFL